LHLTTGVFDVILYALFFGDLLWWWRADRALYRLGYAKAWRIVLGIFMASQAAGLVFIFLDRSVDLNFPLSKSWLAFTYIWHCLMLFPMMLLWVPFAVARAVVLRVRRLVEIRFGDRTLEAVPGTSPNTSVTRREFARLLAVAAPALVTLGTASWALWEMERFRIRRMQITLSQLPAALDGLTIAHVTDIHVGQFTHGKVLERIVAETNALQADLILYTGDLINFELSDLATGLDVVKRLEAKHGVFMCEGNHDLFQDADEFRARTRAAGMQLLVNEAATVEIRGEPVQLLGLRWGARDLHPRNPASRSDEAIETSMEELLPLREASAFPILLAHHPHAFDFAGDIPLTLTGHTHGGQLMVTPDLGCGPMLYRYWSGLYEKEGRALVVSNGTGNWFPLRTRAPAEIVHITLRCGQRV